MKSLWIFNYNIVNCTIILPLHMIYMSDRDFADGFKISDSFGLLLLLLFRVFFSIIRKT